MIITIWLIDGSKIKFTDGTCNVSEAHSILNYESTMFWLENQTKRIHVIKMSDKKDIILYSTSVVRVDKQKV